MKRGSLLTREQVERIKRKVVEFDNAKPQEQRILSPTYQRRFAGLKHVKEQLCLNSKKSPSLSA
jgi:hypothetical protein